MKYIRWIIILGLLALNVWIHQTQYASQVIAAAWMRECGTLADGTKTVCLKKAITRTVGRFGIDAAFEGITSMYDTDPAFAAVCHDFTHLIGREAYKQFQAKRPFRLSTKTGYCAFGFYHGFMETLLFSGGDLGDARRLCNLVQEQLGDEAPNAVAACYHGVGHGSVDIHNPQYWGDELALIAPGLAVCRKFAQEREELRLCGTGVFDSLSLAYYNHENGFTMRADDPLWMCRQQGEVFKESCYMDMMPAMLWLGHYDLSEAAPLVVRFAEEDSRALALKEIASGSIRYVLGKKDPISYLAVCRQFSLDLTLACVGGLGAGVMQFGRFDMEYADGLAFCGRPELSLSEKHACFASVLSYVRGRYSQRKADRICEGIAPEYQIYCKREDI